MPRFFRNNGLSIVMLALFLFSLLGQSITGYHEYNQDQQEHGQPTVSYAEYHTTGHFVEAVFENWESEFLQMSAYVLLTAYLFQKGSAESKDPDGDNPSDADPATAKNKKDAPWPVRRAAATVVMNAPDRAASSWWSQSGRRSTRSAKAARSSSAAIVVTLLERLER